MALRRAFIRIGREMLLDVAPVSRLSTRMMAKNSEIAVFALAHGISVFCEKPVATDMAALTKLEDAYQSAVLHYKNRKNLCFCGMFGIDYLPHFETAYRFVKSGALGISGLQTRRNPIKWGAARSFIRIGRNTAVRSRGWRFMRSSGFSGSAGSLPFPQPHMAVPLAMPETARWRHPRSAFSTVREDEWHLFLRMLCVRRPPRHMTTTACGSSGSRRGFSR